MQNASETYTVSRRPGSLVSSSPQEENILNPPDGSNPLMGCLSIILGKDTDFYDQEE